MNLSVETKPSNEKVPGVGRWSVAARRRGSSSFDSTARGFALIELAIVIVIMSLLLGGGLVALNSQTENQRINNTGRQMNVIKVALENYIARTGRLPCPARADLAPSNAAYGVEAPRNSVGPACTGTVAAGGGFKGIVPWLTLGLTSSDVLDGWSHRITYHVALLGVFDGAGNERTLPGVSGMRGVLSIHNDTPVAAGLPSTGNQVNACSTTAGDNLCNGAAVVVLVSHGKNGLGAWQENGTRLPVPAAGSREEVNTDDNAAYLHVQVFDSNDDQHFDDVVVALAPRDLLTPLIETRQVKAEKVVLTEGFEAMKAGVLSWALDNKDGNEYDLPGNVGEVESALTPNVPKDPWGTNYRYNRDKNSIGASTSAGPAYRLFSNGPDRATGSGPTTLDDIEITVSVAEVKAQLAKTGF